MLSKKERVSRLTFQKRPVRTGRFIYGSIKGFEGDPAGAVVVSKKVCRTAPARNKLRRRIYNILRPLIRTKALQGNVIVYPNALAMKAPFQELKKELEKRLGVSV
ncbi:MAG: ribonuclease P protein component [Patescibacteria group bacterium]